MAERTTILNAPPMPTPDSRLSTFDSRSAAVVLAAGEARRFGAPKLLLPFGDSTVIGRVVATLEAAGAAPIVVVTGEQTAGIAEALSGTRARIVRNPDPSRGMLSSIQAGVAALPAGVEGFLIALGDQPRIASDGIRHLIAQQRLSGKGIVIPTCDGRRGHPVVFAGWYREAVLALSGQQSLRDLVRAHESDCLEVPLDSDGFISDIDTREEYERELRRLQQQ